MGGTNNYKETNDKPKSSPDLSNYFKAFNERMSNKGKSIPTSTKDPEFNSWLKDVENDINSN